MSPYFPLVALIGSLLVGQEVYACNEACGSAAKCGSGGDRNAPSWVNLAECASKAVNDPCNLRAGSGNVRPCVSSTCANSKKCTYGDPALCGAKYEGVCAESDEGVKYCKKTGKSTGNCDQVPECNGVANDNC